MNVASRSVPAASGAEPVLPISDAEFAARIGMLGYFESKPDIAVAVSGGPDSMALILLAHRWAQARGGRAHAVTVDHAIRPEAAAEAAQVGTWLAARDIHHTILRVTTPLPAADLQAAARGARYRLLDAFCADHHILHLLVAHHLDDQAETFLLRLARGSGVDGLSAMRLVAYRRDMRVLRPLLDVPRQRLAATCDASGQLSIVDPSNRNPRFQRVRLRAAAAVLEDIGLTPGRLGVTAQHMARAQSALDSEMATLLARAAAFHPAGFCRVDTKAITEAPREIGTRALASLITTIGGAAYSPRYERLLRLYVELVFSDRVIDRTLGGCRIIRRAAGPLLILRELAAIGPDLAIETGLTRWDNRFAVRAEDAVLTGFSIGALGQSGISELKRRGIVIPPAEVPRAVLPTLPCIRYLEELFEVPHLNYCRTAGTADTMASIEIVPDPENACTGL